MDQIISNPGLYNLVFRIFGFLDSESLKNLRIVSKTFEQFICQYYQREIFIRSLKEVKILYSDESDQISQGETLQKMFSYYEKHSDLDDLKKCAHLFKKYENKTINKAIEEAMETGNKEFIDLFVDSKYLNTIYPMEWDDLSEKIGDKSKVNTFKFLFNNAKLWNFDPFEDPVIVSYACIQNNGEALKTMLDHDQFEDNVELELTPLKSAILAEKLEMLKILLDSEKIIVNSELQGYLNFAVQDGNPEIVKALLQRQDIDVNLKFEGNTPLFTACNEDNPDVVELLLEREDIDINIRDNNGFTPFILACLKGNIEVVKLFLEREDISHDLALVLHLACHVGQIEVVKVLLNHKNINVNAQDTDGRTPLFMACDSPIVTIETKVKIVKMLLDKEGIDIEAKNYESGLTAIDVARNEGLEEITWMLENHGKPLLPKFVSCLKFLLEALE